MDFTEGKSVVGEGVAKVRRGELGVRVARKLHKPFGNFIRQRGALVLTLSPLHIQPSVPYHGATMEKKINHSNIVTVSYTLINPLHPTC